MSYQTIHELLDTQLATVSGLPTLTTENERNTPVSTTAFTRSTLIPARPNLLTIGLNGRAELEGLYQVDLYYPKGSGAAAANIAADAVIAAFPRNVRLTSGDTNVRIVMAWREAAEIREGFYCCIVEVEWVCVV